MNSAEISTAVSEVQAVSDTILDTIKVLDPDVAVPAALAETILNLIAELASKAIAAYHEAAGIPITVESVRDLLPNSAPLSIPDATGA